MKKEYWKPIFNYEGLYEVSNLGRVRSLNYSHTGKPQVLKTGYCGRNRAYKSVILYKEGKRETKTIHRLVAQAFIPNSLNLPEVNHKDENTLNNCAENLEWCDKPYNMNYGTRNKRVAQMFSRQVYQYTLENVLVKIWESTNECGRNGYKQSAVSNCCSGKRKTHKGYKWSYEPL